MVKHLFHGPRPNEDDEELDEADDTVLVSELSRFVEANTWSCHEACWRDAQCSNDRIAGLSNIAPAGPQHITGLSRVCKVHQRNIIIIINNNKLKLFYIK